MATPGQDRVAGVDKAGAAIGGRQAGSQKIGAEWEPPGPTYPPHLQGPKPPFSSFCWPWGLEDRLSGVRAS